MTKPIERDLIYRGRRFQTETIELCVRWYITYRLSYRDLAATMAERGVVVSHTTIMRWVLWGNAEERQHRKFVLEQRTYVDSVGKDLGVKSVFLLGLAYYEALGEQLTSTSTAITHLGSLRVGPELKSYQAAWNAWGKQGGNRVHNTGSNYASFVGGLLTDNRGEPDKNGVRHGIPVPVAEAQAIVDL